MSLHLTLRNRQRTRAVDLQLFRQVVQGLLAELPQVAQAELGIYLLGAPEMARLNEDFLHHAGATDVITFDYAEQPAGKRLAKVELHGEIFICVDEAIAQARQFRTRWPTELVRYAVHGTLHLLGYDDHHAAARRQMKREENRLLRRLAARFPLSRLARKPRLRS